MSTFTLIKKETVPNKTTTNNESASSSAEVYTNKKGQKWKLDEKADFAVSSAPGAKISFLKGKIDPLKVHPDKDEIKNTQRACN